MKKRMEHNRRFRERYEAWADGPGLGQRLRRFLFSGGGEKYGEVLPAGGPEKERREA